MIDLGLSRITHLIRDRVGQLPWQAVHIAGTNGKGSVAAYLSALFRRKGIDVGRFTSPHLIDRWDCITLNQVPVARSKFLAVEEEIKQYANQINIKASEFELLTTTAFELFSRERMQIGVIECGMGGLRDATNVLSKEEVLCSAITKVGLDHQDFLGNTIEEIATEKAGIAKESVPIVVDGSNLEVVKNGVCRVADAIGSPYSQSTHSALLEFESFNLSNLPSHQKDNLSLALTVFNIVASHWSDSIPGRHSRLLMPVADAVPLILSQADVDAAIEEVQRDWEGRLQWLDISSLHTSRISKVLLDGAHNTQSAEVLNDFVVEKIRNNGKAVTWVIAMSAGKDIDSILSILVEGQDRVIACQFGPVDGMPWVKPHAATEISRAASEYATQVAFVNNVEEAVKLAVGNTDDSEPIVIAGSLYLVSDVLRLLPRPSQT